MKEPVKITDPHQALLKAQGYCAYQERAQQEVRDKLYEWGMWPDAVESIISELIVQGYLNEARFATAFAGGKFRIKKWGRVKIKMELKKRRVSDNLIRDALKTIDEIEYVKTLQQLLEQKSREVKEKHPLKKQQKVMRYLASKGFEQDLIWDLFKNQNE
ncbi:MAG: RecX family transcriptional regulator [Bacteroidetes bacterium]|jgi:regulatory protein|nr:RecX family transcriptional regulator [Bacteroidota bacterium]